MSGDWLDRGGLAAERILDAAGELFAERGVDAVGMSAIATAAGCSRATLYRYFPDRAGLRLAFVQREAARVGRLVADELSDVPADARVVEGVLSALRHVRGTPVLTAWFRDRDAGTAAALAQSSEVVEAVGLTVTSDSEAAQWLVRAIVSLLTVPGADEDDERHLVQRFVAPVVTAGLVSPASLPV